MSAKPWKGLLFHSRNPYDDWGVIRDLSGRIILQVKIPPNSDLTMHRANKTDPTQVIVDAILERVNRDD